MCFVYRIQFFLGHTDCTLATCPNVLLQIKRKTGKIIYFSALWSGSAVACAKLFCRAQHHSKSMQKTTNKLLVVRGICPVS